MRPTLLTCVTITAGSILGILRHDQPVERYYTFGATPAFASVLAVVRAPDGADAGSAVLVAPRWVLTAAHITAAADGGRLLVKVGERTVRVDSVVFHPRATARDSTTVDLLLLRLAEPVTDVAPAVFDAEPLALGTRIASVGYGRFARAFDAQAPSSGTRHAFENVLDTTGGSRRSLVGGDLDHPTEPSFSTTGGGAPLALEGVPNGGDSGGGMFVERFGSWRLAGIVATTTHERARLEQFQKYGFYGSVGYWTRLDTERAWIAGVLATTR